MKKVFLYFIIFIFFISSTPDVLAADLSVIPSSNSVQVSEIFTANIYVFPDSKNVNAFSGTINYPVDKLEVLGLSKSGSVVDFWVQEPSYSSVTGKINFEGISLNGFVGNRGQVLTISFRAKKSGNALVEFANGSVLENDGSGSEVINKLNSTSIIISDSIAPTVPETDLSELEVFDLGIRSSTHPDSNSWYLERNGHFSWDLGSDVDAIRTVLSQSFSAKPTIVYEPAVSEKYIEDLPEGVSYLHIQVRENGVWGGLDVFKIKVDYTPPTYLNVVAGEVKDKRSPVRSFILSASDVTSGVEKYSVYIDDQFIENVEYVDNFKYQTPKLYPGIHNIKFLASDFAKNEISKNVEVEIEPLETPEINIPKIDLVAGEKIVINGKSNEAKVLLVFEDVNHNNQGSVLSSIITEGAKKVFEVDVIDGEFSLELDNDFDPGYYFVSAYSINEEGGISYPTEKIRIRIYTDLSSIEALTKIFSYLLYIASWIVLVIFFIISYSFIKYRLALYQKVMKRRKNRPDHLLHDEFELLQSNIESHLAILERTQRGLSLSKDELKAIVKLMSYLKKVEVVLKENLDKIGTNDESAKAGAKSTAKKNSLNNKDLKK